MKKNMVNGVVYALICILILAYIMIDYFLLKPLLGINTGIEYWIGVGITIVIILLTMVVTRYQRKQNKVKANTYIQKYQEKLNKHFATITNNALYEDLETFIKEYNENVKVATYLRKLDRKIAKCKKEEKKKKLIAMRNLSKEEILKLNVKYTKISSTKLYSNVLTRVNDDPNQIVIHDGLDTAKMLGTKAVFIVIGALFTGSVAYDFYFGGASALFGTLLKIIMITSAIIGAIAQADKFVDGEIESVLKKRMRISISFINSSEKIKSIFGIEKPEETEKEETENE